MDVAAALLDVITALLGANLVGVYAYEEANEQQRSAIHLVVVTARDLLRDRKYGLTQTLLRQSSEATPLDVLVVRQTDLLTEQPAVPVQLHYAERGRASGVAEIGSTAWLTWPDGAAGSVDRGALLNRLQQTSRALAGRALADLLDATPAPSESTSTPAPGTRHEDRAPRQLPFA